MPLLEDHNAMLIAQPFERGHQELAEDYLSEEEFDAAVISNVSVLSQVFPFLATCGHDVRNLVQAHLERLYDHLNKLQQREHPRAQTVKYVLTPFFQALQDYTSLTENYFVDRDLAYFLKHANTSRFEFGVMPFRFPDFLLILILSKYEDEPEECLRHLKTILRYGISKDVLKVPQLIYDGLGLSGHLASQAVSIFSQLHCWNQEVKFGVVSPASVDLGRFLMRSLSPVQYCKLRKRGFEWPYEQSLRAYLNTEFEEFAGLKVMSLQNCCRHRIRSCLHASWGLPDNVQSLDIPSQLKAFLNMED